MRSYLMDLELRLHLAAEDVDVALEMDSARALQRIPAAVQEITHLKVGIWHLIRILQTSTGIQSCSFGILESAE